MDVPRGPLADRDTLGRGQRDAELGEQLEHDGLLYLEQGLQPIGLRSGRGDVGIRRPHHRRVQPELSRGTQIELALHYLRRLHQSPRARACRRVHEAGPGERELVEQHLEPVPLHQLQVVHAGQIGQYERREAALERPIAAVAADVVKRHDGNRVGAGRRACE